MGKLFDHLHRTARRIGHNLSSVPSVACGVVVVGIAAAGDFCAALMRQDPVLTGEWSRGVADDAALAMILSSGSTRMGCDTFDTARSGSKRQRRF